MSRVTALLGYVATVTDDDGTTATFGLVGIGFGLAVTAGTFIAFAPEKNHKQVQSWLAEPVQMRLF